MIKTVTRRDIERVLVDVLERFAPRLQAQPDSRPQVFPPGFHATGWTIAWHDGPPDWAILAYDGGFDEDAYARATAAGKTEQEARTAASLPGIRPPEGMFLEPVNGWCLGLYPA